MIMYDHQFHPSCQLHFKAEGARRAAAELGKDSSPPLFEPADCFSPSNRGS